MIRTVPTILLVSAISLASAAPALAAPDPSPVAPEHTTTACANVLAHNVQATEDAHSALQAQLNFAAVGAAFHCG
jgi:hypothetical protein